MTDDRERLMKYPKQVLVDYFIGTYLMAPDWDTLDLMAIKLEIEQMQAKSKKLMEQLRELPANHPDRERIDEAWWRIHQRWERLSNRRMEILRSRMGRMPPNKRGMEL